MNFAAFASRQLIRGDMAEMRYRDPGVCTAWQFSARHGSSLHGMAVPGAQVSADEAFRPRRLWGEIFASSLHDTQESTIQSAPWSGSSFQRLFSGGSRILLHLQLSAQIDDGRTDRWTDHWTDHSTGRLDR
jgi:hypothetical protein